MVFPVGYDSGHTGDAISFIETCEKNSCFVASFHGNWGVCERVLGDKRLDPQKGCIICFPVRFRTGLGIESKFVYAETDRRTVFLELLHDGFFRDGHIGESLYMDGLSGTEIVCDDVIAVRLQYGRRFRGGFGELYGIPRTELYPVGIPEIFQELYLSPHDIGADDLILRSDGGVARAIDEKIGPEEPEGEYDDTDHKLENGESVPIQTAGGDIWILHIEESVYGIWILSFYFHSFIEASGFDRFPSYAHIEY